MSRIKSVCEDGIGCSVNVFVRAADLGLSDERLAAHELLGLPQDYRRPCGNWAKFQVGEWTLCQVHYGAVRECVWDMICGDAQFRAMVLDAWDDEYSARRAAEVASSPKPSLVYFVERDGFVKIGVTTNLKARLRALTTGSATMPAGMRVGPLTLLATLSGDRRNERYLHKRFSHLRFEGEWFLLDDEIRQFIAGLSTKESAA